MRSFLYVVAHLSYCCTTATVFLSAPEAGVICALHPPGSITAVSLILAIDTVEWAF